MEELADLQTVLYDKTGTLTKAQFKVTEITAFDQADPGKGKSGTKEEVLEYLAHAEANSQHPLALTIQEEYVNWGGQVDWKKSGARKAWPRARKKPGLQLPWRSIGLPALRFSWESMGPSWLPLVRR